MNIAAEFEAALPEPRSVLGMRLLPLSIGRYRTMARHGCAFASDEETTPSIEDLMFGAVVCAHPVSEFESALASGELEKRLNKYGKWLRKEIKRTKGFNVLDHIAQFQSYIADGQKVPWVVMPRNLNGEGSITHWSNDIEVTLRGKIGWTKEEVDEQPLTKALADYFKYCEQEGAVTLYRLEEYQELNELAENNGEALSAMVGELKEMEDKHGV